MGLYNLHCPVMCHCVSAGTGNITATCRLDTPTDYIALSKLDNSTTALTCVVAGAFQEDRVHFENLPLLQNLTLTSDRKYSSYQQAAQHKATSDFTKGDLFQPLSNLKSLSISLVLHSFNAALLRPLHNLVELAFSNTYMFQFNEFCNILKEIRMGGIRIERLRMSAVQRVITPDTMIRLREHIYENLKDTPLKVLDLSDNKAIVLQQGLVNYLPRLEIFRLGASELMIFDKFSHAITCMFGGNIMHEHLREYSFTFPKVSPEDKLQPIGDMSQEMEWQRTDELLRCIQNLNITSNLCDLVDCVCCNVSQLPCKPFEKTIHIYDLIKPTTPDRPVGICIPPPPKLETFVFLNFPSLAVPHNVTFCFNPVNRSNEVTYIDVSYSDLKFQVGSWFGISGLRKLRFFNLQGNGIYFSNEIEMFADMPALEVLLLAKNNLSTIAFSTRFDFLRLQSLIVLDLENCEISSVPTSSLSSLINLEILNLSMNSLTKFDVDLSNLTHLRLLNLSGNQISTLTKHTRNHLDTLKWVVLDVSVNPLRCFCDDIEFIRWLHSSSVKFVHKDATVCSHPTLSIISPWKVDVDALERYCLHFDAIISSAISGAGVALVVTAILVLYKSRWRIRYWLYAVRESWKRQRAGERYPLLAKHYTYDAFVAYSSNGEERSWVHTTLREKLENEHGLRLCMYHRDFRAGEDLAEMIVESINNSNTTLLILTPNFLNSGWCEFEVRMANEKVISERRDSVVIVIFKPLDKAGTRLPKTLARLIEKNIYIEWTDNPEAQRLFWRRLVDFIKKDRKYDAFGDMCDGTG